MKRKYDTPSPLAPTSDMGGMMVIVMTKERAFGKKAQLTQSRIRSLTLLHLASKRIRSLVGKTLP